MSANAPQQELIQLIYSHLKEHGFSSAADELQRHSPQVETHLSASLQDIYSSWLKGSKNKKQTASAKKNKSKGGTPTKAKKTTSNKKDKSPKKPETKTASSTKRKKSEGKSAAGVESKKLKTEEADETGADSDSDSSLDVEKWKKLLQTMTEADQAKMDSINALDSKPEPKKRVRKPRAKPTAKPASPGQTTDEIGEKGADGEGDAVTPTKKSTPRKSQLKKTTNVTSDTPSKGKSVETAPTNSTNSPPKQKTATVSEETTSDSTSEPQKKKKKKKKEKEAGDVEVEAFANETSKGGNEKSSKEKKKHKNKVTKECADIPVEKKTKGSKGDDDRNGEDKSGSTGNEDALEPATHKKKPKKRKGDKDENPAHVEGKEVKKRKKTGEEFSEQTDLNEKVAGSEKMAKHKVGEKIKKKKKGINIEGNSEQEVQENAEPKENIEQVLTNKKAAECEDIEPKHKRKKKKKQADLEGNCKPEIQAEPTEEQNSEQTAEEKTLETENTDTVNSEESTEPKEKKKKKKKKKRENLEQIVEGNTNLKNKVDQNGSFCEKVAGEESTERSLRGEEPGQTPEGKKKKKKKGHCVDPEPPSPFILETPNTEKKKLKSILKSAKIPQTPELLLCDVVATPSSSHKKKKKSSEDMKL